LQSNTPCLHAYVDMYLDLAFRSWVGIPRYSNRSCYSYGYQAWAFDGGDSRGFLDDGDWAPNEFNAECAPNQWGMGVSASIDGADRAHSLLCATTNAAANFVSAQRTLTITNGNDGYGSHLATDWDHGYIKGECAPDEIVTGLSQDGNGALNHVRCTTLGITPTSCRPLVFSSGDFRETPYDADDWAPGTTRRVRARERCGRDQPKRGRGRRSRRLVLRLQRALTTNRRQQRLGRRRRETSAGVGPPSWRGWTRAQRRGPRWAPISGRAHHGSHSSAARSSA
jgi:hypothetical protein